MHSHGLYSGVFDVSSLNKLVLDVSYERYDHFCVCVYVSKINPWLEKKEKRLSSLMLMLKMLP